MDTTYYKVCRVRCLRCGNVLEYENRSKTDWGPMMTCSCGRVTLDPVAMMYRIVGNPANYEDLSEQWEDEPAGTA